MKALPFDWYTIEEVAFIFGVGVKRVHMILREDARVARYMEKLSRYYVPIETQQMRFAGRIRKMVSGPSLRHSRYCSNERREKLDALTNKKRKEWLRDDSLNPLTRL